MTEISSVSLPSVAASTSPADALRKTAHQLEGVFVDQLFKAMRETVPHDGYLDGGSGEDMFTSMLDSKVADEAPAQWSHGLADAIYRQLQSKLPAAGAAAAAAAAAQATVPDLPATTLLPTVHP